MLCSIFNVMFNVMFNVIFNVQCSLYNVMFIIIHMLVVRYSFNVPLIANDVCTFQVKKAQCRELD